MEVKKKKKISAGRLATLTILLIVFLTSSLLFIIWLMKGCRTRREMDDIRALIQTTEEGTQETPGESKTESSENEAETPDEPTEEDRLYGFDREAYLKYRDIYELNNDFIGWLIIPDTSIDYPVFRKAGETDYYLWRNAYENDDDHGVPFMDGICVIGESDNLYIYAHHKLDGTMFFDLEKFRDKEYYETRKYIYFETLERGMEVYEVAITFMEDIHNETFEFNHYYNFTNESFAGFYDEVKSRQLYETDTDIEYGDELLTLVTCERMYEKIGRFILIAKRVQ